MKLYSVLFLGHPSILLFFHMAAIKVYMTTSMVMYSNIRMWPYVSKIVN